MARFSEIQFKRYVALLWGPPKVGKTVLASQFPQPFFIDLDDGLKSVKSLRAKWGLDFDFDVVQIDEGPTEDEDFVSICGKAFVKQPAWLKVKKLTSALAMRMPQDSTLVLDNMSRASEFLLDYIRGRTGREQLQIQDWGTFLNEMLSLIVTLKSKGAKCNVVIIGHEATNKDEVTGEFVRHLLIPGQSKDRIPSMVNEFLRLETRVTGTRNKPKIVRVLRSIPDPRTATGSQALLPDIENPTYEKMKPYLEASLGRDLPEPTWTPPE